MKGRTIYMRHVKARITSWLNSGPVPVVIPSTAGPVMIAVYNNGRYVIPETVQIPDSLPAEWGPDGPVSFGPQAQPPEKPGEESEEEDDDDSED